ncbi:neural cell adhesion molecule L1-like [Clytia hemisphaerica]|uniref:Uncharacterized protein n=1 Tax=Clytia hemisphaerica TaxID=252671 RepID=A0A7M5WV46_9CNID
MEFLSSIFFLVLLNTCKAMPKANVTAETNKTMSIISLQQSTNQRLVCNVKGLPINKSFKLSWYKGNEALSKETFNNTKNEHQFQHELGKGPEASGAYRCEVRDGEGSILSSDSVIIQRDSPYLTIKESATIPVMNIRTNETKQTPFIIECAVSSFPRANVTFTRLGELLNNTNPRVEVTVTEDGDTVTYTLTLSSVTFTDAAEYFCRASNRKQGQPQKMKVGVIHLAGQECSNNLIEASKQLKCPNQEKCISTTLCGKTSHEQCKLYRCERPSTPQEAKVVRCTHNAVELQWSPDERANKYIIHVFSSYGDNYVLPTNVNRIVENGLRSNQEYTFIVEAMNDFAISDATNVLKCKTRRMEPPSRVLNTKVDRNNENEVVLRWDLPRDDGMKAAETEVIGELQYEVKYCPQQKVGQDLLQECKNVTTKETSLSLPLDVNVDVVYKFTVIPINGGGVKGEAHTTIQVIPTNDSRILKMVPSVILACLIVSLLLTSKEFL